MQITEQPSLYDNLEKKSVREILEDINREDQKVALAVQKAKVKEYSKGIYVKFKPEEVEILHNRMKEAGVQNMSAYIRKMALNGYEMCIRDSCKAIQ